MTKDKKKIDKTLSDISADYQLNLNDLYVDNPKILIRKTNAIRGLLSIPYENLAINNDIPESAAMTTTIVPVVNLIPDDSIKDFGQATYDSNENILSVKVAPFVMSYEVDVASFNTLLANGQTTFDAAQIYYTHTANVDEMPTCRYYVPSDDNMKEGAEQIEKYPFNKGRKAPQCTNTAVNGGVKFGNCDQSLNQYQCSGFAKSEWSDISTAYLLDEPVVSLQRKYVAFRIPQYRVARREGDELVITEGSAVEMREHFNENVAEIDTAKVIHSSGKSTSYLETVLS